jgi:hypothetical protein
MDILLFQVPTSFQNLNLRSSRSALSSPLSESARSSDGCIPVIRDKVSHVYTCDDPDPADDDYILENIDPIYFSSKDFDPKKHELKVKKLFYLPTFLPVSTILGTVGTCFICLSCN